MFRNAPEVNTFAPDFVALDELGVVTFDVDAAEVVLEVELEVRNVVLAYTMARHTDALEGVPCSRT